MGDSSFIDPVLLLLMLAMWGWRRLTSDYSPPNVQLILSSGISSEQ